MTFLFFTFITFNMNKLQIETDPKTLLLTVMKESII